MFTTSRSWVSGLALGVVLAAVLACAPAAGPPATMRDNAPPAEATLPPELTAQIDRLAASVLDGAATGAIVSVADPTDGTYLKAYGTSDAAGTPMSVDTHYRIESVTKTFTASAVLDLIGQGRLALDDPLARFVSGIPYGESITVRDLLGMRGGVYDFTTDPDFAARYEADPTLPGWSPDDALRLIRTNPDKAVAPRTRVTYSNSEYVLLGYVIERASGRSAPEYLAGLIDRMALPATSFPADTTLPTPFSRGYVITGEHPATAVPSRDTTAINPLASWTAGALVSTVPDMTRYAPMLATGAGLAPQLAVERWSWNPETASGVRVQYGLGVRQLGDWVGHEGTTLGYSTMVFHLPTTGTTVVVMVNAAGRDAAPAQDLWREIVELLRPGSLPQWS